MTPETKFPSMDELWAAAQTEPEPDWRALYGHIGLRRTIEDTSKASAQLLADGEPLSELWRFGILQTLDYYRSAVRRGGIELGAQVLLPVPERTGAPEIDAAFAALADHLAEQDGWQVHEWALNPSRTTTDWFANTPSIFRDQALRESPRAFRQRGIYITAEALWRA